LPYILRKTIPKDSTTIAKTISQVVCAREWNS